MGVGHRATGTVRLVGDAVWVTLKVTTKILIRHTKASLWFPASTVEGRINDEARTLLFGREFRGNEKLNVGSSLEAGWLGFQDFTAMA